MALWDDLKKIGSTAVGNIVSSARKQATAATDQASKKLVPGIVADLGRGFDSIFRSIKARVVSEVSQTPLAQEARKAELERMTPQIIAAAAGVFALGLIIAWLLFRRR